MSIQNATITNMFFFSKIEQVYVFVKASENYIQYLKSNISDLWDLESDLQGQNVKWYPAQSFSLLYDLYI